MNINFNTPGWGKFFTWVAFLLSVIINFITYTVISGVNQNTLKLLNNPPEDLSTTPAPFDLTIYAKVPMESYSESFGLHVIPLTWTSYPSLAILLSSAFVFIAIGYSLDWQSRLATIIRIVSGLVALASISTLIYTLTS